MPCNDIAETINIKLDLNDRLQDYSFVKRACGGNIGKGDLILNYLKGRSIEEISRMPQTEMLKHLKPSDDTDRFVIIKHLMAIQTCLELLNGQRNINPRDNIRLYSVNYGPDGIDLEADVNFDFDVKDINPCIDCKNCFMLQR